MSQKGRLVVWHDTKGYGFIQPDARHEQVFVHISNFNNQRNRPRQGQVVRYEESHDDKGRLIAVKVRRTRFSQLKWPSAKQWLQPFVLAIMTLLILGIATLKQLTPWWLGTGYLLLSITTMSIYAVDKSAAQRGLRRTPELTLHLFAVCGGWPGALLAQKLVHHKSRKAAFQRIFWLTVAINLSLLSAGLYLWKA